MGDRNAISSAVRATLDKVAAAANGTDIGSAALWRQVLASVFGVALSDIPRLSVSESVGRRLNIPPSQGIAQFTSVLVTYEMVIPSTPDSAAAAATRSLRS